MISKTLSDEVKYNTSVLNYSDQIILGEALSRILQRISFF